MINGMLASVDGPKRATGWRRVGLRPRNEEQFKYHYLFRAAKP